MSLLSAVKNAEHTFVAYAEKEWAKIYNEAPVVERVTSTVLKYVGPALQMVVSAEMGAPAGALVGSVIKEAQTDLLAASSLIYDFGAAPSLASIFSGVNTELSGLLTDGHITGTKSVSIVNRVIQEIEVLVGAIQNAVAAPAVAAPAVVGVTPRA